MPEKKELRVGQLRVLLVRVFRIGLGLPLG